MVLLDKVKQESWEDTVSLTWDKNQFVNIDENENINKLSWDLRPATKVPLLFIEMQMTKVQCKKLQIEWWVQNGSKCHWIKKHICPFCIHLLDHSVIKDDFEQTIEPYLLYVRYWEVVKQVPLCSCDTLFSLVVWFSNLHVTDEMSPTTFTVTYMGHCAVQLVILGVRIYKITNIYLCSMCSLNILICFNNFENYPPASFHYSHEHFVIARSIWIDSGCKRVKWRWF